MTELERAKLIVELLQQTSTKEALQEFLKSRSIPSSGTWDDLLRKRVIPAIEEHTFSSDDLVELLRSAEEYGRQHVFLYRCAPDRAVELMDRDRVTRELLRRGEADILTRHKILDQPTTPTLTDVRWHSAKVDLALIIKEVETRESQHPLGEERSDGGTILTKRYELRKDRAVNVVRLTRDGLLEVRISARSTGSTKYKDDLERMWIRLRGLLSLTDFRPVSFLHLKSRIVSNPDELAGKLRFSTSTLRNEDGTTMNVASRGVDADLYGDDGASNGIKAFLAQDGYCEGSNFFFTKNAELSKDVHILLSGEINEFAITAACSEEDYRYVLNEIRKLSEGISGRGARCCGCRKSLIDCNAPESTRS